MTDTLQTKDVINGDITSRCDQGVMEIEERGLLRPEDVRSRARVRRKWLIRDTSKRGIGIYLTLSGILSLAPILESGQRWPEHPVGLMFLFIPLASYALMIISGLLLFRRNRFGMYVAVGALLPQVLAFQAAQLSYKVFSVPSLEIRLWPEQGVSISSAVTSVVLWHGSDQSLYLGLSVCPLILLYLLSDRIERMWAARGRLKHRTTA